MENINNNNSRMVSRHSSYSSVPASSRGRPQQSQQRPQSGQQSQHQPQPTGLRCNRCRKALATTVFVCKCDCVFCEECTYQHFNQSSSCPSCNTTLGAEDFIELCIADPTPASLDASKNSFQDMLTKYKQGSPMLTYSDMCNRILKSHDDQRHKVKFLIRQLVNDVRAHGNRSGNMARINEKLTQEVTQVKQAASGQRIQYDRTVADLQNRLSAMTVAMQEKDKQVQEKDKQITQFRQHYAAEGMARLPSSSNSIGSYGSNSNGGRRTRARSAGDGSTDMTIGLPCFQQQQQQEQQPPPPPLQGFVQQKEAREHAKAQALAQMTRSRGPFQSLNNIKNTLAPSHHMNSSGICSSSSNNNNNNMMMMSATPIVLPPGVRLSSSGSGGSSVLTSGRVRDMHAVSTNNFSFSSRSSHGQQQQQQHHQTRPPSTAFAFNQNSSTSGGYRPDIHSNNNNNSRRNGYGGGGRR